jgi:hypothetical protein
MLPKPLPRYGISLPGAPLDWLGAAHWLHRFAVRFPDLVRASEGRRWQGLRQAMLGRPEAEMKETWYRRTAVTWYAFLRHARAARLTPVYEG